jgi:hypothetical protein
VPYQLHLLNAGTEGHDFNAPDFFSSIEIRNTEVLNERKTSFFLEPGQTTDIYISFQRALGCSVCAAPTTTGRE